jgi:hypothetical protein
MHGARGIRKGIIKPEAMESNKEVDVFQEVKNHRETLFVRPY